MTVIVSCPLLATKTRLPSGEQTMFQGSAPVRISPFGPTVMSTWAEKLPTAGLLISMTETELPAALATKAHFLSGVSAMLCGSVPTVMLVITWLKSGRMTLMLLLFGLTVQINWSSAEMAIGLE